MSYHAHIRVKVKNHTKFWLSDERNNKKKNIGVYLC